MSAQKFGFGPRGKSRSSLATASSLSLRWRVMLLAMSMVAMVVVLMAVVSIFWTPYDPTAFAAGAPFTPPSGPSIPASNVSWSNLGANGGLGMNGTLSSSSYALVFQSDPASTSGHIDLGWTLSAPGSGIRAGNHQLTIRWRVESITP